MMERKGTVPGRWVGEYPFVKGLRWTRGSRFTEPVPVPLSFTLKPLNRNAEDHGPEIPEYLQGRVPLFRQDLVSALFEIGVDNLDLYDALLIDPDNGKQIPSHKAVNIIGVVAAADMDRSIATVHTGGPVIDVDFDRLVINEAKTQGALMFRLAESTNAIMVHEIVRNHLLDKGFSRIEFFHPKDVAL